MMKSIKQLLVLLFVILVLVFLFACAKNEPAATGGKPEPTSVASPAATPSPTPTAVPTPTPSPEYIVFENDKITISYLGFNQFFESEAGIHTLQFRVKNMSDAPYYITTGSNEEPINMPKTEGEILIDGEKHDAFVIGNWDVPERRTRVFNVTIAKGEYIESIEDNGSLKTATLNLYFTNTAGYFCTGEFTVDLLNPLAFKMPILKLSTTDLFGNNVTGELISNNRLTMVNFWATWCDPCVEEMPDLSKLAQEYAEQEFGIIGVLTDDDENMEGAKEFLTKSDIAYPVVLCEGILEELTKDINVIPITIFFDAAGNQVGDILIGGDSYDGWKTRIEEMLNAIP